MDHEPTVLDYVRSKIFFWRGEQIEIPTGESHDLEFQAKAGTEDDLQRVATSGPAFPLTTDSQPTAQPNPKEQLSLSVLARLLAPLVLALIAQRLLEPPERAIATGVALYAIAAAWVVWASWRGEWLLAERLTEYRLGWEESGFRPISLLAAVVLGVVAFVSFGGNQFTIFNLMVWTLSIVFFLRAFWKTNPESQHWIPRLRHAWNAFLSDGISISPWTLLMIVAIALTVFFRLYMLDQVPGEMFSDHAEKLLDVSDVLSGEHRIFFPRNSGRESFQMYLTAAMALIFNTGLTFMSLKLGTALAGVLTLPFIYLAGKEIANRRVGLFAMVFAGIAYWPNVISRVGLRFTLYPFFFAPTLYFLVRGFRRRNRNDFILAGISLGMGLHGYSAFRCVPLLVLVAFTLYLIHRQSQGARKLAVGWLALTGSTSLLVSLPLLRYWLSDPQMFSYRTMSRMTGVEQALPGPALEIFLTNAWKAIIMFFWDNGEIWVHSVTHRPALEVVSAALFFIGVVLLIVRYVRKREWMDSLLLLSIPLLMMPSILSLAFPGENPSLNRTGAAMVPVFLIVGFALDGFVTGFRSSLRGPWGCRIAWGVTAILLLGSINQNYDLVFHQYKKQFDLSAWNTSKLGAVIRQYADTVGDEESAWVIPYPHWVDTRLVGIRAGVPLRDYALWADQLETTLDVPGVKMFLFKSEDGDARDRLRQVYPDGNLDIYESETEGKDFCVYLVPAVER